MATVLVVQMKSVILRSWRTDSPGHSTPAINGVLELKTGRIKNHQNVLTALNRRRRIFSQ